MIRKFTLYQFSENNIILDKSKNGNRRFKPYLNK